MNEILEGSVPPRARKKHPSSQRSDVLWSTWQNVQLELHTFKVKVKELFTHRYCDQAFNSFPPLNLLEQTTIERARL